MSSQLSVILHANLAYVLTRHANSQEHPSRRASNAFDLFRASDQSCLAALDFLLSRSKIATNSALGTSEHVIIPINVLSALATSGLLWAGSQPQQPSAAGVEDKFDCNSWDVLNRSPKSGKLG